MRAKDIMTSPVHVVAPDASVETAAELMTGKSVTALPVVDNAGLLVGMVGESDLLWHRVPSDPTVDVTPHRDPDPDPEYRPRTVAEVMSPYPVTTAPDADVAEVAEVMLEHDVRSIPVLDGDTIAGIISRRDILRAMVRGDDTLTKEVQHRLDEYAGGSPRWTVTVHGGVATVVGTYDDDTERQVVAVLARTVPGVAAVHV
jgi:CBS domain-containing protein